ncbi:MAG TPA: BamA/TamA family outer membrane protein [Anaeromyxobacteraceae bacterium]|nr:BamA/TamA family outer membrane protein [Anaeromyxobacteraceae bacterium]
MLEHRRTLCVAAVVLAMGCATGERRDLPQVHSVRIEGARKVQEGDIKKHILTTENSWVPFSRRQYFEEDAWKTDLRRIEKFYRAQGFYQAKVTGAEVKAHGQKEVDVFATVEEGDPTRISSVNIQGLDDLPDGDRKQLLEQVELKVGQIFIVERWDGLKEKLLHTLLEEGYAAATAQGEVKVGLDTHAAEVTVSVDHGPRYRFGAVSVKKYTPSRVSPWRITEQATAEATPGDWYSLKAQSEAEARVFKMGVFGAVKLKPAEPDPGTLTVPLQVDAQESRFHTVSVGGGIAVDQTRQELRATSRYIDRDFLGGLRRLTLNAMAGYAWIPTFYASTASGAQRGVVGSLSGELEQPRLLSSRDLKLDSKLTLERGLEPAYSYYGGRAKLAVVYAPTNHLTITPSYNLEFYRLESGSAQLTGPAPALLFGCPENCVLSYAEELVEWDMRDDRQEPHRGYYLALSLQEGGGILGGSFGYFRIVPEARGYVSFLEQDKLTFAARVKVGTLIPGNGNDASSPIVSRFYSGGNDMRGFNSRRLSPEFVVPQPGSTTLGYTVPVGGNGLFESSFEARYNLTGALVLAAFVDTGFVTRERLDARAFRDDILVAFGAGLRYRTPVGPIRVDFGYRPDIGPPLAVTQSPGTSLTAPTRSSCFGLGSGGPRAGAPEGPCVLHISIGEAF